MFQPLLVDLYCGAGAVSRGYQAAGYRTIGVDLDPRVGRRYPGAFICADALSPEVRRLIRVADAVHASPPCLRDTELHASARREQRDHGQDETEHPDLITPTVAMLEEWSAETGGRPWTLENVMGADLPGAVVLNGFMFGLGATLSTGQRFHLDRPRKFLTNWPLQAPTFHRQEPVIGVYGGHVRNRSERHGGRGTKDFPGEDKRALMCEAMGILDEWGQTMSEMSQAVPPAYTEFIGAKMWRHLRRLAA